MKDKSKKWIKWSLITFLSFLLILILLLLFVFELTIANFAGDYVPHTDGNDKGFSEKAGEMVDIEKMAEKEDRERFLHYQVVDIPADSKERIAVRFNTMDEKKIGIIDEHGNVIKEPFLHDKVDCYCSGSEPSLSLDINYGNYIDLTKYGGGFYNLNLEQVALSSKEKEDWYEQRYLKEKITKIDLNENDNRIIKISDYFVNPKNYRFKHIRRWGENGIYVAEFLYDYTTTVAASYCIFLDENFNLISHFYYSFFEDHMLLAPSAGSKIGVVYVKNLGLVYFNIDGEIIWITYCDQITPNYCEQEE